MAFGHHSTDNTEVTAEGQQPKEEAAPVEPVPYDPTILPPRTGYLRVSWYRRTPGFRPYPAAAATGLAVTGISLFALGLALAGAHGVSHPGILSGLLIFSSGLVEIITGIWAIVDDNLFGSIFLLGYGAFFSSLGTIYADLFSVASSYNDADELNAAIGIFLSAWTVFTFFLWTATFKSTIPLTILLFFLFMFFLLYTIAVFGNHHGARTAAGVFAFLTSAAAFYGVHDGLNTPSNSYAPLEEAKFLRLPGAKKQPTAENRFDVV